MKERYDPSIRKTPCGKRVYAYWKKVRQNPHTQDFEYFPDFLDWAMKNGYKQGYKLILVDAEKPYSTTNCIWVAPACQREETGMIDEARAREWNMAVNRIRKQLGMEPLEGTDYAEL